MTNAVRRILVVDDEASMRHVLTLNLEAEGFEVEAAEDGEQAVRMAEATRPDLVVLDIMMPGLDGLSVLSRLKSSAEMSDIPVVLLTAKATDGEIWEGWQAGADYYLTKPFDVDELLHYIDLLTSSRRVGL